jgi:hypothetical protein
MVVNESVIRIEGALSNVCTQKSRVDLSLKSNLNEMTWPMPVSCRQATI